jgi:hypothetical protein
MQLGVGTWLHDLYCVFALHAYFAEVYIYAMWASWWNCAGMLHVHAHSFQPRFQNQTFLDLGEVHDSSKTLMVKKPRSIVGFYLPASRLIPDGVRLFKIDEFALYLMHMHFGSAAGSEAMQCRGPRSWRRGRGVAAGPLALMAEFQRVECTGDWPGSKSTASQNRLIVSKKKTYAMSVEHSILSALLNLL